MVHNVGNLEWQDMIVMAVYFVLILTVGALAARWSERDTLGGYFLARRTMHWLQVGASLFASNIGSEHFIGLAGSGSSSGITVAGFELNSMFILLLLGWIFLPVYMASGVYTVPEYLKRRFGGQRIESLMAVFSLLLYIFAKISVDLYSGSLFVRASFSLSTYPAIVTLLVFAAIFTIAGGQGSVIWTDFVQVGLMISGALTVCVLGFQKVGGYEQLMHDFYYKQPNASVVSYDNVKGDNQSCSQVSKEYSHLLRPFDDPTLPWTGAIFGISVSAIWYWCTDQVIVQRGLSSRNLTHGKAGCVLAGYFKFLPLFLVVFPGMISRVLYTDQIACSNRDACDAACGSPSGCSNYAYPTLILNLLPAGLRGLLLAVILATLMCSLAAVFNGSSTVFTVDIWNRIRKNATQLELLIVGRIFVLFMVAVSIIWIPVMEGSQNAHLFDYLQSVQAALAPPVAAVFVAGMISERVTEPGAFWGLLSGIFIGICRFGLSFGYPEPACGTSEPDNRPLILSKLHYLNFGALLFVFVLLIVFVFSYWTEPIVKSRLVRLTFWTRHSNELRVTDEYPDPKDYLKVPQGQINPTFSENPDTEVIHLNNLNGRTQIPITLDSAPSKSKCRKIMEKVLGLPSSDSEAKDTHRNLTPVEDLEEAQKVMEENPIWKRFADVNGIILLAFSAFVWGYYH